MYTLIIVYFAYYLYTNVAKRADLLRYQLLRIGAMKRQDRRDKKKDKIFRSRKINTQFNVILPIKQIVCTSTGERGKLY